MFIWLKSLFNKKSSEPNYSWKDMISGDHVRIWLKDPTSVGFATQDYLTFQRLDAEDIKTLKVDGYVIRKKVMEPGSFELLEISVIKKTGKHTRLQDYVILKEEVERVEFLGE